MKEFTFNYFGTEAIIVRFPCDKCSSIVESERIGVPEPNYMADNSSDSQVENEGYASCPTCKKDYEIEIMVAFGGGDGWVANLITDEDVEVEEIDAEYLQEQYEAIADNTAFFDTYTTEIADIKRLLEVSLPDPRLQEILYRQLYAGVIGTMEVYLSDAFINTVFKTPDLLKRFFRTFKDFSKQKIAVSAYYEFEDKAEEVAKKAMLGIMYHNLPLVSGIYKDTLNIKFPEFGEVYKAVRKRHHFVHRNGKDKNGNMVLVDKPILIVLLQNMDKMIGDIDEQLKLLS